MWTGRGEERRGRPVAPFAAAGGDAGQWRDGAEATATAGELEGGHVVLDTIVIAGEGRRSKQVHGAVRADQTAAGEGRCRREEDGQQAGRKEDAESSHRSISRVAGRGSPTLPP